MSSTSAAPCRRASGFPSLGRPTSSPRTRGSTEHRARREGRAGLSHQVSIRPPEPLPIVGRPVNATGHVGNGLAGSDDREWGAGHLRARGACRRFWNGRSGCWRGTAGVGWIRAHPDRRRRPLGPHPPARPASDRVARVTHPDRRDLAPPAVGRERGPGDRGTHGRWRRLTRRRHRSAVRRDGGSIRDRHPSSCGRRALAGPRRHSRDTLLRRACRLGIALIEGDGEKAHEEYAEKDARKGVAIHKG
jgi:hypothetical protein